MKAKYIVWAKKYGFREIQCLGVSPYIDLKRATSDVKRLVSQSGYKYAKITSVETKEIIFEYGSNL